MPRQLKAFNWVAKTAASHNFSRQTITSGFTFCPATFDRRSLSSRQHDLKARLLLLCSVSPTGFLRPAGNRFAAMAGMILPEALLKLAK